MSPSLHRSRRRDRKWYRLARVRLALSDRRGNALIEFGFAFPTLLLFVVGLIEFSMVLWTSNALQLAADEAGRYAIAHPTATASDIQAYATGQLVSVDTSTVTVTVTNDTTGGVNFVTVTVSTPFEMMTQILPLAFTLTGSSRVPLTG